MTMAWVAVGTTVVSAAAGIYSSSQAASNSAKQASAMSNAENDAIAKQNMSQMVRNSYRTGMLNMQLGLQKKRAVQEGFDTSVQYASGKGSLEANQVAAGAVGASADAVMSNLDMAYGQAQQKENFTSTLDQYNQELDAMRMNALNNVVEARKYEYNGPSSGQIIGGALINAAVSAAGSYAMRQMSLGLGPQASTATNVQSTTGVMAGFRTDPFGPSQSRFNFGG